MNVATAHKPVPGRPREFDLDNAVSDAMNVFWDQGYHATSLPDLIAGTGLSRGSLYKAFGDKKNLFLAALDHYCATGLKTISEILAGSGSAKAALRQSLLRYAKLAAGTSGRRGCFVMATAAEMTSHDADIARRVDRMFRNMQKLHADAIVRGQAAGEIPGDRNADLIARFFLCQIEGMRILGKTGASEKEMNNLVEIALRVLD